MRWLVFALIFTKFIYADIIGGVETSGYKPTLKYKIADYSYSALTGHYLNFAEKYASSCSATRIAPQVILTAAHCFQDQIVEDFSRKYFHPNEDFSNEKKYPALKFDDQSIKVSEVNVHPEFIKISHKFKLKELAVLESFVKKLITEDEKRDRLAKLNQEKIEEQIEYDVAVVTTQTSSNHFYPPSFKEVDLGERVEIVGYGMKYAPQHFSKLELDKAGLVGLINMRRDRLRERVKIISGMRIETFSRDRASEIQSEITSLQDEVNEIDEFFKKHDEDHRKMVGYNELAQVTEQAYKIKGRSFESQKNLESSISLGDSGSGLIATIGSQRVVIGVTSSMNQEHFSLENDGYIISSFAKLSHHSNEQFVKQFLPMNML